MADYTSETITRTIRRWIIPAAEPWGATAEEISKAWPPGVWWRAVQARQARERGCAPVSRPNSPSRASRNLRTAPSASQGPSHPAPSWARTDTGEAA